MRGRLVLVMAVGAAVVAAGWSHSLAEGPVPTCFGKPADHVLTDGNDDLDLGAETEPQVVVGLGGDDSIHGGQAGDRLCGGAGIDEIYAGPGKDRVNAGAGRDYVNGEGGADLIKGAAGDDNGSTTWRVGTPEEGGFGARLDGGNGKDRMYGGNGRDGIRGEAGDDLIRGNGDIDRCSGGPGDDDVKCEKRLED